MMTSEYEDLKQDINEIKVQLNQMTKLLKYLVEERIESNPKSKNSSSIETLISELDLDNKVDDENSDNDLDKKYIIKRKKKEKKKRNYGEDMTDLSSKHTIIKKEVLKDLETKGYSDVKRMANEEETEPINDPIHVRILYNFGFVLDKDYDKYNAILLLSTVINYNVIHIDVVKKLNLEIVEVKDPFVVKSSSGKFQSNQYVTLTVAVNMNETTNRMFTAPFVVSHDNHHNDMIVVSFHTLSEYQIYTYQHYRFKELVDVVYLL